MCTVGQMLFLILVEVMDLRAILTLKQKGKTYNPFWCFFFFFFLQLNLYWFLKIMQNKSIFTIGARLLVFTVHRKKVHKQFLSISLTALSYSFWWHHSHSSDTVSGPLSTAWRAHAKSPNQHYLLRVGGVHLTPGHIWSEVRLLLSLLAKSYISKANNRIQKQCQNQGQGQSILRMRCS